MKSILAIFVFLALLPSCVEDSNPTGSESTKRVPTLSGVKTPIAGRVINDSPIINVPIYIDVSGDGIVSMGDKLVATTGSLGEFAGEIPIEYVDNYLIAYVTAGTDIGNPNVEGDEKRFFSAQWKAPTSSRVISPMTELQILLQMTDAEFQDFLAAIPELEDLSFDPYSFDPYSSQETRDDETNKILTALETVSIFFDRRADHRSLTTDVLKIEIRRAFGESIGLQEILQIDVLENEISEGVTSQVKIADITIKSSVLTSVGGKTMPILTSGFNFFEIQSVNSSTWGLYLKSGKILDGSVLSSIRASIIPSVFNPEAKFFSELPHATDIDLSIIATDVELGSATINIYENHPVNKEVYRVNNEGTISLTNDYGDNSLFSLTSDGRIWWLASPDFETTEDSDDDNIYEIEVTQTIESDQSRTEQINVQVNDIEREESLSDRNTRFGANWYRFSKADIEDLLPEDSYHFYLYSGEAYALPASGPLVLTWSIVLPDATVPYWYRNYDEDGNWVKLSSLSYLITSTQGKINKQRALFQNIVEMFEQVINIKFIEVSDTASLLGDIRVYIDPHGTRGIAYPFSRTAGGDMLTADMTTARGFATAIHELGHLLGLKHPFETGEIYGGSPDFLWDKAEMYVPRSIMSYSVPYQRVITLNDIEALQFLYGAPGTNFLGVESKLSDTVTLCTPSDPSACYD